MRELLKTVITDFHRRRLPESMIERELSLPNAPGKIQCITGPRRAGKTTYLYSLIQTALRTGDRREKHVYINFEDERLSFTTETLQEIINAYQQLYPDINLANVCFYFDEIQQVSGWEKFVRRLLDTTTQHIYITGSSAKLLSREIATQLRGRTLASTLLPFSLRERLAYFNINPDDVYNTTNRNRIIAQFEEHLRRGGYPETLEVDDDVFIRIMQEYGDVLLYRDVIERHNIHNPHLAKELMLRLFANNAKPLSIHKLYNDFRSQGLRTSKDTLYTFVDHFRDAYAVFEVKRYDRSPSRRAHSKSKIYLNDVGYSTAYQPAFTEDLGQKLETFVYLELIRKYGEVYYATGQFGECDFVVLRRGTVQLLIQVCSQLTSQNRKREVKGVQEAIRVFGMSEGFLLTRDQEETIEVGAGVVYVVPAWKWLLIKDR